MLSVFPAVLAFTAMLGWLSFFIGEANAEEVRAKVIEVVEERLGTTGGPVAKTIDRHPVHTAWRRGRGWPS